MIKPQLLILLVLLSASLTLAQPRPASETELAGITERGRELFEYDVAAWHATDAVLAMKPEEGAFKLYLARKTNSGWTVVFGRLSEKADKFLIVYEAKQGATPTAFTSRKFDTPQEDTGFYLVAAKSSQTALAAFQGEKRPYNIAVLPAESGQNYVYILPAQTQNGVYPHGGDVRYLIASDGTRIIEKRQLHKTILEFKVPTEAQKVEMGYHVAVMADLPEDTDVFYVLTRKPSVPEWIMTANYVYQVQRDGVVKYLMTREAFLKIRNK